ncbi:hypothetical protein JCM10908_003691 [Rhodotorula pacifica]|uniref:mRNA splicing protein SAD1 n=1 Tax=Rhodotorula pacifica TaxID=1495444 RepID=UPI003175A6F0
MAEQGKEDYAKLKVAQLKELLKERELPVSGVKADLVARLEENDAMSVDEPSLQANEPAAESQGEQPNLQSSQVVDADAPNEVETTSTAPSDPLSVKRAVEDDEAAEQVKRIRIDEAAASAVPPAQAIDSALPQSASDGASALPAAVGEESAIIPSVVAEAKVPVEVLVRAAGSNSGGDTDVGADAQTRLQEQKDFGTPEEAQGAGHWVEGEGEDEEEPPTYEFEPEEDGGRPADLYLDTINRAALDFDFERLCSVTLSHNNIYACLVDGKYFQGRGKTSPAYAHALNEDHHVFINLETQKVFVLPDGYEVNDASLADIQYLLKPTFDPTALERIDRSLAPAHDLAQKPYHPGFVGLNNMKSNSYMNAVLQLVLHVPPLRDYFILSPLPSSSSTSELVRRFAMLARKVWNPRQFKAQVSPHEFLQEVANASHGRFKITEHGDPIDFLGWLLNQLHRDLGGTKRPRSSIIYSTFQGEVRVDDQQIIKTGEFGTKPRFDLDRDIKSTKTPFLFLALDLPPPPLYRDAVESNIIPQVPISTVLAKYDGETTREDPTSGLLRRWNITRLPPFLVVYYKRFSSNRFLEEKNPTIVNFPLRGVDMHDYVDGAQPISTYYDLTANLALTTTTTTGATSTSAEWKVHVHLRPPRDPQTGELADGVKDEDDKWFEMQDLVVREIEKGLVPLGETYIQIWERRSPTGKWDDVIQVDEPRPKKANGVAKSAPVASGRGQPR